jgi:hypothetical protein
MNVANLRIEMALLRQLGAMAEAGVSVRTILMRAVADGIIADPNNSVSNRDEADKLVRWYVDSMINIGGAE